jgi:hypothetical protein
LNVDAFLAIRTEISNLNQQVREAFTTWRQHPFRLHAVFIHSGGAATGHYWVYIYDHEKELWRKYNDETVTTITNTNEIFANPWNDTAARYTEARGPPNPYLLVYIDQNKVKELSESVKREIIYPPPDEPPPMPARNQGPQSQMDAMPPFLSAEGDVELLEYADHGKGGEHGPSPEATALNLGADATFDVASQPVQRNETLYYSEAEKPGKQGDWDDQELTANSKIDW